MSTTTILPIEQKLLDSYGPAGGKLAIRLWRQALRDGPDGEGTLSPIWNGFDSEAGNLASDLFGGYLPWPDDANEPDVRPSEQLWADELKSDMRDAATSAALEAAIGALLEGLPTAPESLRAHPGATRLREDLALIEAETRRP